jgi:S1-C subfamily serine protease
VACRDFDGQVVRLEHLHDIADKFVRVRLTRIDTVDLNLFDFDYDLTFMIFFLSAEEKVYARYGGRDAENPDRRQSLAGLHYTMLSVLRMHERADKAFAPRSEEAPRVLKQVFDQRGLGHCMHCHQVKEKLNAELQRAGKWTRDLVWRYPLPENLGFSLEVDRGNVIQAISDKSPAAAAGLKRGDAVQQLGGVPIHSFADAQFALDRAPRTGSLDVVWQRGDRLQTGKLALSDRWRKTDLSWRPSMREFVPSPRLYGSDLVPNEKKALGLSPKQLAFRQKHPLSEQAAAAGIRQGDIIVGIDDQLLETDIAGFYNYVRSNYVVGDRVTINLLRDGKRQHVTMTLPR